ncbi:MAG TPA: hypothetical protein V6C65_04520 [Allocoleopsis sp.]
MERDLIVVPDNCGLSINEESYCIHADSEELADQLLENPMLLDICKAAQRFRRDTVKIFFPECGDFPYSLKIQSILNDESDPNFKTPELQKRTSPIDRPNLYNAGFQQVWEQIIDWRRQELVVTITSMVNDQCLFVNDLQAPDRGAWSGQQWHAVNFRMLWRDSFQPGRRNYYQDLIDAVMRDRVLPEFRYQIRRPSGALGEYYSNYFLVEDYLGAPVRIAVSDVGNWEIVEDKELEPQIYRA